MGCSACGDKPKKDNSFTKAVVEIENPGEITLIRKVIIPASMGDDTTIPPTVGKYKNVLLYYEANSKSFLYSSDGIPTQLVNGFTNYEDAINLPEINGVTLIGNKSSADLKLADAPLVITVADGNTSWSGADTAEDVYNFFLNKGKVNIVFNGGENYAYEIASAAYIPEEEKMMCTLAVATIATGETAEFEGNALFGTMTLYTADKAIDVSQIELQPKLYIADFTGLDLNYNELSGVPATNASIGMVKPGDGLEVASDGTLSISEIEQYAHFFDTVADMKAATNLKAGDYAKTLGYYAAGDGGGSTYTISNDMPLTDDGGSIIALDNGLNALITIDNKISVAQFGIDGTHSSNISNFIAYVNNNSAITKIEFEPAVTYALDLAMVFNKETLDIDGNNATIKISAEVKHTNLFQITATKSCRINNLVVNGDDMAQDQWSIQSVADYSYRRCFYITSPNIAVDGIIINNVWGQGLQLYGYNAVEIKNCIFDKIGGDFWYHDPDTGSFDFCGDAVYLSGHEDDANISINNCMFIGYENTDSTSNDSRCGVVFENLAGYTLDGTTTNLTMFNTIIKNFSRPLHHEAYHSITNILCENCDFDKGSTFTSSSTQYPYLVMDNCRITYHNQSDGYLGTSGIYKFNAEIKNSKIDLATGYNSRLGHEANIIYKNCIINNIHGLINTNSTKCELRDCVLNFSSTYSGDYLNSASYPTVFRRCTFNASTQYASTNFSSGSVSEVYSCVFNDIYPTFRATLMDFKSVLNFETSPSNRESYYDKRMFANGFVTVGGERVSVPNICGTLLADEHCYIEGNVVQSQFNSSSLPIIPATLPSNIIQRKNTRYIMLMYGTNDWTNQYTNTFQNIYYTDLTFNNSGTPSIGTINTRGTIPSNNELTFSGTTVTGTGSSALRYITWILPYEYKQTLGL